MKESQAETSVSIKLKRNLSLCHSFVLGSPSCIKFCKFIRFHINRVF